ncbi:lycopene cyclase domain-containing protein [Curtobacterium sp. RRHDQ10]|uniref:lycopene cyclase domain-containing protein n=1 Tax=Curtobacterium phyllosphaerae TaxID=3413379 RepID=UPI003BF393D7
MTAAHGTYALLDAVFLAVAAAVAVVAAVVVRPRARAFATGLLAGAVLLVMTIVFDNVIVGLGIVAYDPSRISGVHLGFLPIEDLAYAIAAVVLLPSLWVLFRGRSGGARGAAPASARDGATRPTHDRTVSR